ncbi:hypothetical protein [Leptolyngbya sp. FACHB-261]|uniref:hypothetical protein n=1 Tax=Leptolyngbya sp. FACHB-261 TaxID=2692806 RepID=UPI0016854C36|nr:hypothetical protein [Leptolyngbya sp. FACHB-261]MBD2102033.1 hypothetical protein [Leptolyngbya sp. FACHB-261]
MHTLRDLTLVQFDTPLKEFFTAMLKLVSLALLEVLTELSPMGTVANMLDYVYGSAEFRFNTQPLIRIELVCGESI